MHFDFINTNFQALMTVANKIPIDILLPTVDSIKISKFGNIVILFTHLSSRHGNNDETLPGDVLSLHLSAQLHSEFS